MPTLHAERVRCFWATTDAYCDYHDTEWGRPVADDVRLFEKLSLEGFQCGLSWLTILRKRAHFRAAFHGFQPDRVAAMTEADVARLLADTGIVRHRGKIEATIGNARAMQAIVAAHGSLAAFIWQFEPTPSERPTRIDRAALKAMSQTPASKRLSKALKQYGFRFVGPTTVYALMQAMGLVNDHLQDCWVRETVEQERVAFQRPTTHKNPQASTIG